MWELLLLGLLAPAAGGSPSAVTLNIAVHPGGVAHVHAVLTLPANPAVVHAVLTDYPHWPLLFPNGLRIVAIQQDKDGVQTDLYLRRHFLPGELHLVTLTREAAPGILETSLVDGDFYQYRRTWTLTPGLSSCETHAELAMDIQPKQGLPGWLFTFLLRRELLAHFDRLRAEVQSRNPAGAAQ
jgi:ribosome-associated toxin RatA of RatAB toxin-antitoxin module